MKPLLALVVIGLVGLCHSLGARDYWDDVVAFRKRVPKEKQKAEIERLLLSRPDSPETYILAANWYWNDGVATMVLPNNLPSGVFTPSLGDPKVFGDGSLTFGDAGVMREEYIYSEESRRRAVAILETARSKFPNRVDIHLGLRSLLDALNEIDREIEAIETFVSVSKKYSDNLLWEYGDPVKGTASSFVEGVLFEILSDKRERSTKSEEELFVIVSRIMARECPRSAVAWTFLSAACLDRGDVVGRYKALTKALALAPTDKIVLRHWLDINVKLQLLASARDAAKRLLRVDSDIKSRQKAREMLENLDRMDE